MRWAANIRRWVAKIRIWMAISGDMLRDGLLR
jgi:hypothetical protein